MKAKLIFDLSDSDDIQKFERMSKSYEMCDVIWNYLYNSRKKIQQKIESQEGEIDALEAVAMCFQRFGELLEENDLNIDKIWS